MKLLDELLKKSGADLNEAFTVVPDFGAYFKCVKSVEEFSQSCVILKIGKRRIKVEGGPFTVQKYFEGDLFLKGNILGVRYE